MKKFIYRIMAIGLGLILLVIALASIKFYYFDIFRMSLNGQVKEIRVDIKQTMHITVKNEEYNLAHFWPVLQENVEVGDSLYKKSDQYDIILIKRQTKKQIICHYKDYTELRQSGGRHS